MEPDNPLIDDHVLGLARASRGRERPRVCFLATASGDSPVYIATFYASYARKAEASHLALFMRTVDDVEAFLLDQDVIYVGGGNTENMLAVWRVHGVDRALRQAWESGIVMTGLSAGSLCWFETGTTDSFGGLAALSAGLGLLPGSHSPHYDGEPNRRPYYQRLVGEGRMPGRVCRRRWRRARLPRHGARRGRDVASRRACVSSGARRLGRGGRDGAAGPLPGLSRRPGVPAAVPRGDRADRRRGLRWRPAPVARSRRSGPSRAARARAPGRPAAPARTAACRPPGAARPAGGRPWPDPCPPRSSARPAGRSTAIRARPKTSRSRSSSRGPQRRRRRRPKSRSRSLSATSSASAPVAGSGPAGTSRATTALRNSGWSVTPTGAVAYNRDTPRSRTPGRSASASTAAASVAAASPTLAPRPMYARTWRSVTWSLGGARARLRVS